MAGEDDEGDEGRGVGNEKVSSCVIINEMVSWQESEVLRVKDIQELRGISRNEMLRRGTKVW